MMCCDIVMDLWIYNKRCSISESLYENKQDYILMYKLNEVPDVSTYVNTNVHLEPLDKKLMFWRDAAQRIRDIQGDDTTCEEALERVKLWLRSPERLDITQKDAMYVGHAMRNQFSIGYQAAHYAVYVGQGIICHVQLNRPHHICQQYQRPEYDTMIWLDSLHSYYKPHENFRLVQFKKPSLPVKDILNICSDYIGPMHYSTMRRNCEHFVRAAVTGSHESKQISRAAMFIFAPFIHMRNKYRENKQESSQCKQVRAVLVRDMERNVYVIYDTDKPEMSSWYGGSQCRQWWKKLFPSGDPKYSRRKVFLLPFEESVDDLMVVFNVKFITGDPVTDVPEAAKKYIIDRKAEYKF
jgi:hypothetical protein